MVPTPIRAAALLLSAFILSGCISPTAYVDSALPKAGKEDVAAPAIPRPIQAIFEFRTRGVANASATQALSSTVFDALKSSGAFSEVSTTPVAGDRRLVITIDNVPITSREDAMAKGFGTGLTFGLVGSMVTDGYNCEAIYTSATEAPTKHTYKHAIHATIGNASGPPGIQGQKPIDAAKGMVGQITWSVLRDLGKDGKL